MEWDLVALKISVTKDSKGSKKPNANTEAPRPVFLRPPTYPMGVALWVSPFGVADGSYTKWVVYKWGIWLHDVGVLALVSALLLP